MGARASRVRVLLLLFFYTLESHATLIIDDPYSRYEPPTLLSCIPSRMSSCIIYDASNS